MIQKMILALVMMAIAAVPCAMTFAFRGRRGEERPRCIVPITLAGLG